MHANPGQAGKTAHLRQVDPGRVLIVDDDPDVRLAVRSLLELHGYAVTEAGDGTEALQLLDDGDLPGAIVLDLTMPRMDGETFLGARSGGAGQVPVVVLTARPREKPAGAHSMLTKPFDFDELLDLLEAAGANPIC